MCIEDSYIATGDDLIAIKSGWDEYGIAFGRPSVDITIRRITGTTPFAVIAIGSEASGGVENVLVEHINVLNSGFGINIKTNAGRGGTIRNITISDVYMDRVRKAIRISGNSGDHPDNGFNPYALPIVDGVTIKDVWGFNVEQPGSMQGIKNSPFTRICLSNVKLYGGRSRPIQMVWQCGDITGAALQVNPSPCAELISSHSDDNCFGGI